MVATILGLLTLGGMALRQGRAAGAMGARWGAQRFVSVAMMGRAIHDSIGVHEDRYRHRRARR